MHKLRFRQIHLDFHTSEHIPGVGSEFDPDEFVDTLKRAHVNSITCFSRCHHGMIYHDTRFAEARHPHLECNLLNEQIDACHAADIRVPIYITVGWDELVARRHPEWLERMPDGSVSGAPPLRPGWKRLCFNTPHIDYVIEQTQEVLDMFEVDGLFFDIIHQGPCVCQYCLEKMWEQGLDPEKQADRLALAAQTVDEFKRRMTAEIRKKDRDCTIFYNAGHIYPHWRPVLDTYTHLEIESLPSGAWGYAHFPTTVRYARNLGMDCLGMTGKFQTVWGDFSSFKNQAALEYECFTMLANAAKCSVGDQLHPTGKICPVTYDLIGRVYASVEEKERWCEDAEAVADIGVFTPEAVGKQDGRVDSSMKGVYHVLVESQQQFDVIDAESDWSRYAVVILPDKITCDHALAAKASKYAKAGGALILSHKSGLRPDESAFALPEVGASYVGDAEYCPDFVRVREAIAEGIADTEYVMYERGAAVRPGEGTEILADVWNPYFNRTYRHFCSHRHTPVAQKGEFPAVIQSDRIIYFSHPIFRLYATKGVRFCKQIFLNCLARLLPEPLIRTDAPSTCHITVNRQPQYNRHVVHLLHYIPERRAMELDTIEEAIPLFDVALEVWLAVEPKKAYLAPTQDELHVDYADGYASVTVPEVRGHQMVVFEA